MIGLESLHGAQGKLGAGKFIRQRLPLIDEIGVIFPYVKIDRACCRFCISFSEFKLPDVSPTNILLWARLVCPHCELFGMSWTIKLKSWPQMDLNC